ncbi:OLC1v1013332C1 [Oldenlandia corymbosa var. corymbosa]|uniref:OLC1v1013332C1 n=1 Tax=Oldenlandia corymbosa var. corymbosa TaxID=529605 RepID=A0AAV1DY16_OLDCO|nr:OLC1v1013332C1 [Oldenlandia corymbosa var. corymbosa]
MSSDFKGCEVKVVKVDAQFSLRESVIVTAIGCLLGKDNIKRVISQTFFLAKQEIGWFVLNDNFRIIYAQGILNISFGCKDGVLSPQVPEHTNVPIETKSVNKVAMPAETKHSIEETLEVQITDVPKDPDTSNETGKVEGQKMVAPNQQSTVSPKSNIAKRTKEQTSDYAQGSITRNNVASRDSRARSIYIENLPKDITKDELAEAVKVFGVARPSGFQIRTCPFDGFCFGFVEFESEVSAKSAAEARKLTIKGSDARISIKKSGTKGTGGEFRSRNFRGQDKGKVTSNGSSFDDNGERGYDRQNREFGERNSESREGRAYGGEGHPKNKGRNRGHQKNGQVQNGGGSNSRANSAAKA